MAQILFLSFWFSRRTRSDRIAEDDDFVIITKLNRRKTHRIHRKNPKINFKDPKLRVSYQYLGIPGYNPTHCGTQRSFVANFLEAEIVRVGAEAEAFKAQSKEEVEAFRIKYLGKKLAPD